MDRLYDSAAGAAALGQLLVGRVALAGLCILKSEKKDKSDDLITRSQPLVGGDLSSKSSLVGQRQCVVSSGVIV
jgi:hypothetical protein